MTPALTPTRKVQGLVCALALGALVLCAPARPETSALGGEGELYTPLVGNYGDLFPEGAAYAEDQPVLALEVAQGKSVERILVPGGDSVATGSTPFVVYEGTAGRLFLLWEGYSHIHSNLNLTSFDGVEFSQPLLISGNPFTKKSSPQLAVTRETFVEGSDEAAQRVERTVIHTVWYEDDFGEVDLIYSPVVLQGGAPLEQLPPLFNLGDFVTAPGDGAALVGAEPPAELLRSFRVLRGDGRSVLIAFADATTGQLVSARIDLLPRELSEIADELERYLLEDEEDACGAESKQLAERGRAHLVVIGRKFSSFVQDYLAAEIRTWLAEERRAACKEGGVGELARRARAHLVMIGKRALHDGLRNSAEGQLSYFLSLGSTDRDDLVFNIVGQRTLAPEVASGATRLHVGGKGSNLLVSWLKGASLQYQESVDTDWLPAQSLRIWESFSLEQAYRALDERAR